MVYVRSSGINCVTVDEMSLLFSSYLIVVLVPVCQLWDIRRKGYVFRYTVRAVCVYVYVCVCLCVCVAV